MSINKPNTAGTYRFESHLVEEFLSVARTSSKWDQMKTCTEFDYQRGRTDIIALGEDGILIAIEAKLKKWRDALHQAYRNTCFANHSYVLLPEKTAHLALKYLAEFERRKVGICYISHGEIVIAYKPPLVEPIQPWLSRVAIDLISSNEKNYCH